MRKIAMNENWRCFRTGHETEAFPVTVPHDAMLLDGKSENSPSGVNAGWYDVQDYTYEKRFFVEQALSGQEILLEFEGVYRKATVFVNGRKLAYQEYGYIGFYVNVTEALRYGKENVLRVEVINSDQPNCRWYSGTGIYRPVWMYVLPKEHLLPESIRITPLRWQQPKIRVQAEITGKGTVKAEILAEGQVIKTEVLSGEKNVSCEMELPGARLWSPEDPYLYTCRMTYGADVQEETFGIRVISCDTENGFCINGKRVILKGACIHHDNGLLGACAYPHAERRKVRLLLENGYNAIRSAHNPCSKAMLKACDELGMLVMDEYVDVWYIHKNKYDYAGQVMKNYASDLAAIVAKDYNHPSVVFYSTGNEVSESAQKKGIAFCKEMTEELHRLDGTRPVTCGINIFFNLLSSLGFGVYSDKKADQAVKDASKKKAVGSEFYNTIAGIFGADFMKTGAALPPCDTKTKDAFANLDVAGYNYGIKRYRHDLKKYPDRLIVGSETFCSDASKFWGLAKTEKRLLGDFVWAGMDYLGEVGIGSWEYADYAPRFDGGKGWVSAGSGRIDLTGKPLCEMKYTQVAFEQRTIAIGVVPVNHTKDRHSPSAWKMSNALGSWSFAGFEGKEARVEVYARGCEAELYVNGRAVGRKKLKDCRAVFTTVYEPGELKAVCFDENGRPLGETALTTAGAETRLAAEPEEKTVEREQGLCYVRLRYTDAKGVTKPLVRGEITVSVEGGTLLGLGSACPYYEGSYLSPVTDTYYGEALAILRPGDTERVRLHADSPYGSAEAEIRILTEGGCDR